MPVSTPKGGKRTYSFLNSTKLLKLLSECSLLGVPCQASFFLDQPEALLQGDKLFGFGGGERNKSAYPMKSFAMLRDDVLAPTCWAWSG